METTYYSEKQTLENWVKTIETKFKDVGLSKRSEEIATILAINDANEKKKIDKASLIVFGKKLGVTSFEDACKKLKLKPLLPEVSHLSKKRQKQQIAFYKLTIIAEAVNNGWEPNWGDDNEYKYYPWFDMRSRSFSYWRTFYYVTFTYVASALCFPSSEIAEYMGRMFSDLYKDYLSK